MTRGLVSIAENSAWEEEKRLSHGQLLRQRCWQGFFFATKRTGSLFSAYCSHSHHSERYDFLLITVLIYHGCMTPAGLITVLIVSSNIFHLPALHWDVF
jgi:hypothetical protein